jgi:hypothetical protein
MSVFLAILAGAAFVGFLYLMSRDSQIGKVRSHRGKDWGGGGSDVHGSSGSGGFDCGADGGCD